MNEKKVSIIIPCYNMAEELHFCWNSLKKQTIGIEAMECIFVDDASTDNGATWRVLESFEREEAESVVIVRSDENLRQGGARNIGLTYASGEYLMFLDADDGLREDACEKLYRDAKENNADLIIFGNQYVDENGNPKKADFGDTPLQCGLYDLAADRNMRTQFLLRRMCRLCCWDKFYRSEMVQRSGARFAERMVYEEQMFVFPMYVYADRVMITDTPFHLYCLKENATTSSFGTRILEHPQVQLKLYEYFRERVEILAEYSEELEYNFIFSFYAETLLFSYYSRARIPLEFYEYMQNICRTLYPHYKENRFLADDKALAVYVESLDLKLSQQQELEDLIMKAGRYYAERAGR